MSSCGANAGKETSTSVVYVITSNALFQLNSQQSDAASNHSYSAILIGRLVAQDFVISRIEITAVWWPQIRKFICVTMVCEMIAPLDCWQQTMHRNVRLPLDTAVGKDHDQQFLSKFKKNTLGEMQTL